MERSRERNVAIPEGRDAYVRLLCRRLGWAAMGAHLVSAVGLALLAFFAGHVIGFFRRVLPVSVLFRPLVVEYVYLREKLRTIGHEVRYPREDVIELRSRVSTLERQIKELKIGWERTQRELRQGQG